MQLNEMISVHIELSQRREEKKKCRRFETVWRDIEWKWNVKCAQKSVKQIMWREREKKMTMTADRYKPINWNSISLNFDTLNESTNERKKRVLQLNDS